MATGPSMTEEEVHHLARMCIDGMDLVTAKGFLDLFSDGKAGEDLGTRLLERQRQAQAQLDPDAVLDFANRLGEDAIQEAVNKYCPPNLRGTWDQLMQRQGGALPLLERQVHQMQSVNGDPAEQMVCVAGFAAIAAGVYIDNVMGGITAVAGIMALAYWCGG